MGVRIIIILLFLTQCYWTCSVFRTTPVSGSVSEDIMVPPSVRAIIEVDVSYLINSNRWGTILPVMGIYTTKDHINIREQCTHSR